MSRNSVEQINGANPINHSTNENVFKGQVRASRLTLPEGNEWRANLLNQTPSNSQIAGEQTFWVTKTTDARELSKKLLTENFGFSDEDYAAYVKKYGELIINDEQKCNSAQAQKPAGKKLAGACGWALPADIANWRTQNGKVPVNLNESRILLIRNFKQERIVAAAIKDIADPLLRETTKENLLKLATGEGANRIEAAEQLADLEAATFDDAEAVRNSIRRLAAEPSNRNNAAVQVLAAKVDLNRALADKQNAFNIYVNTTGDEKNVFYQEAQKKVAAYEQQLQRAINAAAGIDALTGKRPPNATTNRTEAAWANLQLSELYEQMGDKQKASVRIMMARYYQIDDAERKTLSKPRVTLDGTVYGGGFFSRFKTAEMKAASGSLPPPAQPKQPQKKIYPKTRSSSKPENTKRASKSSNNDLKTAN